MALFYVYTTLEISVDRLVCTNFHFVKFIFTDDGTRRRPKRLNKFYVFTKNENEASVFQLHTKDLRWDQPIC